MTGIHRNIHGITSAIFLLCAVQAHSQEIDGKTDAALKQITKTAYEICATVPVNETHRDTTLRADVQAKVSGLSRLLANMGFGGAAQYQSGESQGVLQEHLAAAMIDANHCRYKVFHELKEILLRPTNKETTTTQPRPLQHQQTGPGQGPHEGSPWDPPQPTSLSQIDFGIIAEIFDISNIRYGRYRRYDAVFNTNAFSPIEDAVLFDVRIKSGNGLPPYTTWSGNYFGKAIDSDGIICAVAQAQIILKYNVNMTGWQIGIPGQGAITFDRERCSARTISFADTGPFGN